MRIFGVGLGTIVMIVLLVYIVRKYGNSIPVVNQVG